MHTLTNRQRLEIAAYLVTLALAVPCFVAATLMADSPGRDFLINLSATFAGAGFLFFLINRFFGIEQPLAHSQPLSAIDFFKDDLPDMHERFSRARTIAINGITLSSTTNGYLTEFANCIKRGGSVRIIIVNPAPQSLALEVTARRFYKHQDIDKVRRESLQSLDNLETLLATPGASSLCEIRLSSAIPTFGVWLIDAAERNAEIWAEIYTYRAEREPALHFLPYRDGKWYDFMQEQFELLWNSAEPWHLGS